MKHIDYTTDDNTTALRALKSGKDGNGERIPRAARDTAIRILHRMPAAGTLAYDFDAEPVWRNGWTPTLYAQAAIVDAVQDRQRAERAATAPPKPTDNRGPERLARMFRL